MNAIKIYNETLVNIFGTNTITKEILSNNNRFNFLIPLSSSDLLKLKELNRIIDFFDNVKCTISFKSRDSDLDKEKMDKFEYSSRLINYSKSIIEALEQTSSNFSRIEISSYFDRLDLTENLMKKFIKLDTLIINGFDHDSYIGSLFLPPNLLTIKLSGVSTITYFDTSQINNISDLVLFLDQYFLLEGGFLPVCPIENIDLTENPLDKVFNLNNLQSRFPRLKNLKINPEYKFVGPLSHKEIEFLVKVAGRIQIENSSDTIVKYFLNDFIPLEMNGIKKIGNIYYDSNKFALKPIELSYNKYKTMKDKTKLHSAFLKITIKNMAELSTEEAIKLRKEVSNCLISIKESRSTSIHSLDDYITMSINLDQMLNTVNSDSPEDERYSQIYRAMSSIYYDYYAVFDYDSKSIEQDPFNNFFALCLKKSSRNIYGALKYNLAVCAGFATALHNACARKGLKSKLTHGYFYDYVDLNTLQNYDKENHSYIILDCIDSFNYIIKDLEASHAWNIVKIKGIWYNSDLTWDAPRMRQNYLPKYFLFSDDENLQRKCISNSNIKCSITYSSSDLARIFPYFQPEPPITEIKLPLNIFNILKKYTSKTYHFFKEIYNFRAVNKYKKAVQKYPIALISSPTENTPCNFTREQNIRDQVRYHPYGFAITANKIYEDSSTTSKIDPDTWQESSEQDLK